jgi:hypothetical protein
MSVYVYILSVLSCVGRGLATRLNTRLKSSSNCLYDSQFQVNDSDGHRPEGLRRKVKRCLDTSSKKQAV